MSDSQHNVHIWDPYFKPNLLFNPVDLHCSSLAESLNESTNSLLKLNTCKSEQIDDGIRSITCNLSDVSNYAVEETQMLCDEKPTPIKAQNISHEMLQTRRMSKFKIPFN